MRIAIIGGKHEADFLVKMFNNSHHQLIVINEHQDFCNYLSANNKIPVYCGDALKRYVLEENQINDFDLLISLREKDADNLVICEMASKLFNVKKTVCIVSNPKNVEIFKKLGVTIVISATYLIAQTIKREAMIDNLIKTLTIEENKIVISEIEIKEDYSIVGKMLMEANIPANINISCILRGNEIIIPNGKTTVREKDILIIVSALEEQNDTINFIQKRKNHVKK
jgi:trk system potassium uptake protein TrkA